MTPPGHVINGLIVMTNGMVCLVTVSVYSIPYIFAFLSIAIIHLF
jgi:hypothetical protein